MIQHLEIGIDQVFNAPSFCMRKNSVSELEIPTILTKLYKKICPGVEEKTTTLLKQAQSCNKAGCLR